VTRRPSRQTLAVLDALAARPAAWRHGYDLGQQVGLKAGSLYPILMRLADRGLLESQWETEQPAGRPPRHLYRLTADGIRFTADAAQTRPADTRRTDTQAKGSQAKGSQAKGTAAKGTGTAAPVKGRRPGKLRSA
jgi:PadR family transcriptional regulator, regulatory protein PadR